MQSLLDIFEQTFDDRKLSSAEKKALGQILGEKDLKTNQVGFLRNRIFEFAKKEMKAYSAIQVLEWLEGANKLLLKHQKSEAEERAINEVYFSPGDECRNAISYYLHQAKQSIKICVFTISDDKISEEIIYCHKKGVKIQIITDDDKSFDKGSDIYRLNKLGIKTKTDNTPNHMHHKFALIDEKILITGSYNWTRSAALYNHENILIVNEASVVKDYDKEFNKLWKEFIDFRQ